jgi:hypothetical protein
LRKDAATDRAAVIATVQADVPVHAPVQPSNVEPAAAAAVRVTLAPLVKLFEHVEPQSIPAGALVTLPAPFPDFTTDRVKVGGVKLVRAKVAVRAVAAVIETEQPPVPVHAPDQPAKVDPAAATAVNVTLVPLV